METVRLNKYLASAGICSRREGDELIAAGRVRVNGELPSPGMKVSETDQVSVDGKVLGGPAEKVVYAYYKPVGETVTKKDSHADKTIYDSLTMPEASSLKYAGRLDRDSEGLLLLTNDGDLIEHLMRGSNLHEKEYMVTLDEEPTEEDLQVLSKGVYLPELEKKTRPCVIKVSGKRSVTMILKEGLNREIRRLWETRGKQVIKLKRIRVANIAIGDLKPGKWRKLTEAEVNQLHL